MIEIQNDIRKKYKYKDYVVYVKWNFKNLCYEFYLQNEEYGVISLMFGIPKSDIKDIENIILANIEDYIETYKEEYED